MNDKLLLEIKKLMKECISVNAMEVEIFNNMKSNNASREELIAYRDSMQENVNTYIDAREDLADYQNLYDRAQSYLEVHSKEEAMCAVKEFKKLEKELIKKYDINNMVEDSIAKDNNNVTEENENKTKKANPITWVCVALAVLSVAIAARSCDKDKKTLSNDVKSTPSVSGTLVPNTPNVTSIINSNKEEFKSVAVFPDTEEGKEAKKLYESIINKKCPDVSTTEFTNVLDDNQVKARAEKIHNNLKYLDTNDKQVKNLSVEEIERLLKYVLNGNVENVKAADRDDVLTNILSIFDAEIYDAVRAANGNIKESDARKPILNSMLLATDGSELQENLYKLHLLRQYVVQNPTKEKANVYSMALMALAIDTWYVADPINAYTIDAFDTAGEKFEYQLAILNSLAIVGKDTKETKMSFVKMHEGKEEICEITLKDLTKELNCKEYTIEEDLADVNDVKSGKKETETKYWGYMMLKEALMNKELGLSIK